MTRYIALALIALIALAACSPAPASDRAADSTTLPAVDTLMAVAPADTLPTKTVTASPATKTVTPAATTKTTGAQAKAPTKAETKKLGRDSVIQPPNLPQLDTVKRKKPPMSG